MSAPLPRMRHPTGAGLRLQRYELFLYWQNDSEIICNGHIKKQLYNVSCGNFAHNSKRRRRDINQLRV